MIKKSRKIIASLLMTLSLVSISPTISAFADTKSDLDFLHNQCTKVKGKDGMTLYEKNGKYYHAGMDSSGMDIMLRSTFAFNYYAQDDGSIAINKWIYAYDESSNKNVWRYFDLDGISLKGFQTINGVNYFFSTNGNLCVGWMYATSGGWHYAYPDGSIHEGWIQDNDKWYYIYSDGVMAKSTTTPDGYHVNNRGVCTS